jgi:hypothetical protein
MTTSLYRLDAVVNEDGKLMLQGLPFQAGDSLEITILKHPEPVEQDILDQDYLMAVAATLTEWSSDADEEAYGDL